MKLEWVVDPRDSSCTMASYGPWAFQICISSKLHPDECVLKIEQSLGEHDLIHTIRGNVVRLKEICEHCADYDIVKCAAPSDDGSCRKATVREIAEAYLRLPIDEALSLLEDGREAIRLDMAETALWQILGGKP